MIRKFLCEFTVLAEDINEALVQAKRNLNVNGRITDFNAQEIDPERSALSIPFPAKRIETPSPNESVWSDGVEL